MTLKYNVTGSARKALAGAVSEILSLPVAYMGAPTFAYAVGSCTIERDGTLSCPTETVAILAASLRSCGFEAENVSSGSDKLVIQMPAGYLSDTALENLKKIIVGKEALIKKALGSEELLILPVGDRLCFPWFTLSGADSEIDAYLRFVTALCDMAKTLKRVTAKAWEVENEKFVMRLFLIRLGFVGPELKAARKILLWDLTGNSSWKNGRRPTQTGAAADDTKGG